ncbi:MAG: hypothetical protein WCJ54_01290 [Actinomycetota bacterium]
MNNNKKITEAQREKIVSSCIMLIGRGFSFEYCKIRYKKYESVLEEYFPVIAGLKKMQRDDLSDDFLKNTLSKIYNEYNESSCPEEEFENYKNVKIKNSRFWTVLKPAAIFAAAVLILSFSSIGVLAASQKSLPTSPLYAVKRYSEDFKLLITPEPKKNAVHLQFLNNRLEEAQLFLSSNYLEKNKMESIIKDAEEEFDYCKKHDYFGNYTEEEIDDQLKTIKEKATKEFGAEGDSSESINEKTTGTYYNDNENETENSGGFEQDDSDGDEQNSGEKEESADSEIKEDENSNSEINNDSKTDVTQDTESNLDTETTENTESDSDIEATEDTESNSEPDITQSTESTASDVKDDTESSSDTDESQDEEDEKESD